MYSIISTNRQRQQLWIRLFGRVELPVLNDQPRQQELRDGPVQAYDLDLRSLHPGDRARLAAYAAQRYGMDYAETKAMLDVATSWPIEDHGDIELVTVEERPSPAFSFVEMWRRIGNRLWGAYAH